MHPLITISHITYSKSIKEEASVHPVSLQLSRAGISLDKVITSPKQTISKTIFGQPSRSKALCHLHKDARRIHVVSSIIRKERCIIHKERCIIHVETNKIHKEQSIICKETKLIVRGRNLIGKEASLFHVVGFLIGKGQSSIQ